MTGQALEARVAALGCWHGPVAIAPLPGGLTNRNLLVTDADGRFVVRVGGDIPFHRIDRHAELAATRAAAMAGIGPQVLYAEDGFLVLRYIEGRTLDMSDLCRPDMLTRIIDLLRRCHTDAARLYDGPVIDRSPAAVLGAYAELIAGTPNRWRDSAARHRSSIEAIKAWSVGRPRRFAHNDIHAGNILDDGVRLWLVDWEYAGIGDNLIDIASLAVNGGFDAAAEIEAQQLYFGHAPDIRIRYDFARGRLAAALRDLFWGYAQDGFGEGFDGADYIAVNEQRVARASRTVDEM